MMKRIVVIYCMCIATIGYGSSEDSTSATPKHKVKFKLGVSVYSQPLKMNRDAVDNFTISKASGFEKAKFNNAYLNTIHYDVFKVKYTIPYNRFTDYTLSNIFQLKTQLSFLAIFSRFELGLSTKLITITDDFEYIKKYGSSRYNPNIKGYQGMFFNNIGVFYRSNKKNAYMCEFNAKANVIKGEYIYNKFSLHNGVSFSLTKYIKLNVLAGLVNINYITTPNNIVYHGNYANQSNGYNNYRYYSTSIFNLKKHRINYNVTQGSPNMGYPYTTTNYKSSLNRILYPDIKFELNYYFKNESTEHIKDPLKKHIADSTYRAKKNEVKKHSLFFELLGSGFLYSLNYDRVLYYKNKYKLTGRVGLSYYYSTIINPIEFNIVYGKTHSAEFGIGYTLLNSTTKTLKLNNSNLDMPLLHIAYRYRRNTGLFVRPAISYSIPNNKYKYTTWHVGLGVGYSFNVKKNK